jgi:hypothetical protein
MASVEIQFTEDQMRSLRWLSSKEGRSIEELVRAGVDRMLKDDYEVRAQRALNAVGRFRLGLTDVSENHDKYLAEDFL